MQKERVLKTLSELKTTLSRSNFPLEVHHVLQEDLSAACVVIEEWLKAKKEKEIKVEEQK